MNKKFVYIYSRFDIRVVDADMFHSVFFFIRTRQFMFFDDASEIVINIRADDEAVHLYTDKHYRQDIKLLPDGEKWSSGWYSFGEWSYCVRLYVRKIKTNE